MNNLFIKNFFLSFKKKSFKILKGNLIEKSIGKITKLKNNWFKKSMRLSDKKVKNSKMTSIRKIIWAWKIKSFGSTMLISSRVSNRMTATSGGGRLLYSIQDLTSSTNCRKVGHWLLQEIGRLVGR